MRVNGFAAFGLGLALLAGTSGMALADSNDYRFEAVQKEVAASANATVQVRLVLVSTGKTVTNAVLFQPKMEMTMTGMAPMGTKVAAGVPDGKGVYPFVADLSMAGPWTLTLSAKVQGESATIVGTVPVIAVQDHSHMGGMEHGH